MSHPLSEAEHRFIDLALAEDIGPGDITCAYFVDAAQRGTARIVAREAGVAAGLEVAREAFAKVDPALEIAPGPASGTLVTPGDVVLSVSGSVRSLLTAERVALNFLQRLSGVATLTRKFVDRVAHTGARILDTRKTTPGLRAMEKAAVRAGGGTNHRLGLFDMAMVKDNHLAARGDLAALGRAIERLQGAHPQIRVELEADTVEQVRGFLTLEGVAVILLDNMSLAQLREAVALREPGQEIAFEASGGVNLETVAAIAETGVDYISVGALTHSARALDFSLELEA